MIKLRSYGKAHESENKIYAFQNFKLPFPIAVSAFIYFAIACTAIFLTGKMFPIITSVPAIIRFGAIPYFITTFLRKKKLDGKPPHIFLRDYMQFLTAKNNNLEFFRMSERQSRDVIKLNWSCTHRNT